MGLSFKLNHFGRKRSACFTSYISGKFYLSSGTSKEKLKKGLRVKQAVFQDFTFALEPRKKN